MLLEADPDLALGFVEILRRAGARVFHAESEAMALRILAMVPIDLAVVDVEGLPSAVAGLARIVAAPVPTIALARASTSRQLATDVRFSTVTVLAKPVTVEALISSVEAGLG
jgi:DNA-binding response OmpR family regulator